jgi:hypothetical protein
MCPGPCATQVGVAVVGREEARVIVGVAEGVKVGVRIGEKGTTVTVTVVRPKGEVMLLQPDNNKTPIKLITKRRRSIILLSKKKNAEGAFYPDPRL